MSTKREIQRWDPGVTDMKTGKVKLHRCNIGEFVLYKHHEAARAKDAELIQMLVDAVAIGNAWWYTDHPNDTVEGFENRQKLRDALAAAVAAGFKPIEK